MKDAPARLYAGFDGGGTRTTCVLCDSEGDVLGAGFGGRGNYHDIGVPSALASLKRAFAGALDRSGVATGRVRLEACFGLAGLDSPKDMATMSGAVRSMRLARRGAGEGRKDIVENDWRTAVAGAFIDEPGVTLIAGTGCVAAAQREAGRRVARVGGWGHLVDDRGSGYDIGRDALYAAMRESLREAVERSAGLAAADLKAEKKSGLRVHARTGQPCPVCGDTVREVSFADSSLQYCPTCQTGGKPLADRRLSRLLK